jgi:nitrite reductase/ring-hydroxylating ferredoxin subunit
MAITATERVRVGTVDDLARRGCTVVSAGGHGVAVFAHEGRFYAVDNRCPHMGFPLSRGTVRDGLLTCHWHHARFDLEGGGTLDPFADNVRTFRVVVEDGQVWLDLAERPDEAGSRTYWLGRLNEGLEQGLGFVLAKSVLALFALGVSPSEILHAGGAYGLRYRGRGWSQGMTILTAMGRALPHLAPEDRPLALFHGLVHVSRDTAGQTPRFDLEPLPSTDVPLPRLKAWFRRAVEVRDVDGAERVLQTAIARGAEPAALADILFAACTDHYYLDAGHVLDFINKACEYLDLVGWDQAATVLPTLVDGLCRAQRSEELNSWRHPIDLVEVLEPHLARLPDLPTGSPASVGAQHAVPTPPGTVPPPPTADEFDSLVWQILDGEPDATAAAVTAVLERGIPYAEVGQAVAHASALRVARFHTSNEFGDWDTVHNTWTACQALHQALLRAPSPELARGLYHGAMRIYLDRFLNIPAARLPDERSRANGATSPDDLLPLLDQQQQVEGAAAIVEVTLARGDDPAALIRALGHVVLREDSEFHNYQTLEAGIRQYEALHESRPLAARRTLVAVARYLAAHAPTPRELRQTYTIALRLNRGDDLTVAEE